MQAGEGKLAMGTCTAPWGAAPFYPGMTFFTPTSSRANAMSRMIGTMAISFLSIPS